MDLTNPQQIHGYTYASNNPLTWTDPTGLAQTCGAYAVQCYPGDRNKPKPGKKPRPGRKPNSAVSGGNPGSPGNSGTSRPYGGRLGKHVPGTLRQGPIYVRSSMAKQSAQCVWGGNVCNSGMGVREAADTELSWRDVWEAGKIIVLPDIDSWESCIADHELTGCGWAATDLPWFKIGKLGKLGKLGKRTAKECHSFLPGTTVLLADGTRKNIEDVEVGEEITVTDPETGETATREVVATIVTENDKRFVDLTIDTGSALASLVSTDTHPFWVESEGAWIEAGDLRTGMTFRTPAGKTVTVDGLRHYEQRQRTHDLTVDGIHTYYVVAGVTPVLVHNSNCPTTPVGGRGTNFRNLSPNEPATIEGRDYTGHAIDRMQERGLMPSVVENAVRVGEKMSGKRAGTTAYYEAENNVTVITDTATGRVVTVSSGRIKQ
ncbi:hypothetical protein HCK00_02900 [Streptomyces sp. PLAI1-29]|uniref:Hint domain-containing protein n=2 Tax=Streptomyces zingiberis TaxID=2053010 RepID=A0ABX1BUH4_9ACTN|nr:hypothetical protein [Streptomyces zingiberis]